MKLYGENPLLEDNDFQRYINGLQQLFAWFKQTTKEWKEMTKSMAKESEERRLLHMEWFVLTLENEHKQRELRIEEKQFRKDMSSKVSDAMSELLNYRQHAEFDKLKYSSILREEELWKQMTSRSDNKKTKFETERKILEEQQNQFRVIMATLDGACSSYGVTFEEHQILTAPGKERHLPDASAASERFQRSIEASSSSPGGSLDRQVHSSIYELIPLPPHVRKLHESDLSSDPTFAKECIKEFCLAKLGFTCVACGQWLEDETSVQEHPKECSPMHHNVRSFYSGHEALLQRCLKQLNSFDCKSCMVRLEDYKEVQKHVRELDHMAKIFKCSLCNVYLGQKEAMEEHLKEVHKL